MTDHPLDSSIFAIVLLTILSLAAACGDDDETVADGGIDGGGGGASCAMAVDGTSCGGAEICLRGECTPSRCGDGYMDVIAGEMCDDGNDVAGDGCEPGSCTPSCASAMDCDDGDPCTGTETCNPMLNRCQAGSDGNGMACTLDAGGEGICSAGLCAPPGCGNDVVDGTEDCDDGANGDNDDGCRDDCQFTCVDNPTCSDSDPCNGEEVCDTTTHTCGSGTAIDCDDGDPCTADSCDMTAGCLNALIDADADSYAPGTCTTAGLMGDDCNDASFSIHPGATELCDSLDNDCDGMIDDGTVDIPCYRDADHDTYGDPSDTVVACTCPSGYISRGGDCDDTNSSVNPGHTTYETAYYCPGGRTCATSERSWDWNCDGSQQKRYTTVSTGCAFGPPGCSICACQGSGFISTVPACGEPSRLTAQNWITCGLSLGCRETSRSVVRQSCR